VLRPLSRIHGCRQMSQVIAVRFQEVVAGKSLLDLSRQSGVSRRTLHRLRDGEFAPQPLTRRAIAGALGVKPDAIVYPADTKESSR
jgi:lambda repressor-like predicted transcriptional regulator